MRTDVGTESGRAPRAAGAGARGRPPAGPTTRSVPYGERVPQEPCGARGPAGPYALSELGAPSAPQQSAHIAQKRSEQERERAEKGGREPVLFAAAAGFGTRDSG
jgi:hypothetical protein